MVYFYFGSLLIFIDKNENSHSISFIIIKRIKILIRKIRDFLIEKS